MLKALTTRKSRLPRNARNTSSSTQRDGSTHSTQHVPIDSSTQPANPDKIIYQSCTSACNDPKFPLPNTIAQHHSLVNTQPPTPAHSSQTRKGRHSYTRGAEQVEIRNYNKTWRQKLQTSTSPHHKLQAQAQATNRSRRSNKKSWMNMRGYWGT